MSLLHYTRAGRGNTLVLQHGYLGCSEMWFEKLDYFNSRYCIIPCRNSSLTTMGLG